MPLRAAEVRDSGRDARHHRAADRPVAAQQVGAGADGRVYSGQREKKLRQAHDALRRPSSPEVQLVRLPNFQRAATGKYEGFLLMREGGAPAGGGDNQFYPVPTAESKTLYLPGGLFLNGWIHVLEDSELTFPLMLACLRSRFDKMPVFASSEVRLLQFGLGRDAYDSHHVLSRLGLLKVDPGPHPGRRLPDNSPQITRPSRGC